MSSHGKFVWYELMTPDVAAAGTFYQSVAELTPFDPNMPGETYTMLRTEGGTVIGGIAALPADHPAPPHWIGYIYVDDLTATIDKVTASGGLIRRPASEIPGVGHFAVVADPQGGTFIVFKPDPEPENPQAAPPLGAPGTIGWVELHATDWQAVWPFYQDLFGWQKFDAHDMGPMGIYQTFGRGDGAIGGFVNKMSPGPSGFWMYYFNVADIDAGAARIRAAGGTVINGPQQVPGTWIVLAQDPQAAHFCLVGPKAS